MFHDPGASIIVTNGSWMHIRLTRIYHRHYPEVRGEGRSIADAAAHLVKQLANALDCAHGREREALKPTLAASRAIRPHHRLQALTAAP